MSKVLAFLENVAIPDEDGIEIVTLSEAKIACEIKELETLEKFLISGSEASTYQLVTDRIGKLTFKLKNIKYK